MNTILFSLCWIDDDEKLERNLRWLEYYRSIKQHLKFNEIVLFDNASDLNTLKLLGGTVIDADTLKVLHEATSDLKIYRFNQHLARVSMWDIPYCWRGLNYLKTILASVDKVLLIDSDCYILKPNLARHLNNLTQGWEFMWCPTYRFPEASLSVLCKNSFHLLHNMKIPSYSHYLDKSFELYMPYTKVNTKFKGDRYGEKNIPQTSDMDFYCQASPKQPKLIWDMK